MILIGTITYWLAFLESTFWRILTILRRSNLINLGQFPAQGLKRKTPWKNLLYFFSKNSTINKISMNFMDQPRVDIIKTVCYPSLYSLHCRKNCSILIFCKVLISFTIILALIFLFFFRKISISLTSILAFFVFSCFRKILLPFAFFSFTFFFLKLFLGCLFVCFIIVICHCYTYRKKF